MTKEQRDRILKALAEDRNDYARECEKRITAEQGKIMGADYMIQRFLDVLKTEVDPQECEETGMSEELSREEIAALLARGSEA